MNACPVCGQDVIVREGRAFVPDTIGTLHGCTAPDPEMPAVEGEPMVWDDELSTLIPMGSA